MVETFATPAITRDRLIAQPDGSFTVHYGSGDNVLSVQPDGSFQSRPIGTNGPWESGRKQGNKLIFTDPAYPLGAYAILLAD